MLKFHQASLGSGSPAYLLPNGCRKRYRLRSQIDIGSNPISSKHALHGSFENYMSSCINAYHSIYFAHSAYMIHLQSTFWKFFQIVLLCVSQADVELSVSLCLSLPNTGNIGVHLTWLQGNCCGSMITSVQSSGQSSGSSGARTLTSLSISTMAVNEGFLFLKVFLLHLLIVSTGIRHAC